MIGLELIKQYQTNGINYDVTTEDIIKKLEDWHHRFGITISDVSYDQVTVSFQVLPDNLQEMAIEIYEFCPDIIDQGFGCMDDMLAMMSESGQEIDEYTKALLVGVDLDNPDFGLKILINALKREKKVSLWWD
ncbi:DUF4253 domain-containing protein [Geminocystis herdmanii]|uniref:DUF4253 domain-containing protein n=1 Tax=Geminocystis herdmanii TaxID=669359 RepID=UPI000346E26E|nr:DUF4253 domain-containing protein [Geminocystis herdmanii]